MFKYQLTATTAWGEEGAGPIHADNGNEFASTAGDKVGDHSTFGAEGHPVTGIFDVASGDYAAVIDKSCNSDRKLRIRGVSHCHNVLSLSMQGIPINIVRVQ